MLHLTTLTFALGALMAAVAVSNMLLAAGTVLILGLESYLALRVGLDARLFEGLAKEAREGRLDLTALDAGLVRAGLLPPRRETASTRTAEARSAGAVRLFKLQAALVVLQGGMAVGSIAWSWASAGS